MEVSGAVSKAAWQSGHVPAYGSWLLLQQSRLLCCCPAYIQCRDSGLLVGITSCLQCWGYLACRACKRRNRPY
jgi:hypothetical protein